MAEIYTTASIWNNNVDRLTITGRTFNSIRNAAIGFHLPNILTRIDTQLSKTAQSIRYIAPVRANVQRYYREQDLAVDTIDFKGRNLPNYLRSLTMAELEKLSSWTKERLGFEVKLQLLKGHIEVSMHETSTDHEYNIVDMGFGYSQLLPVIAQLWGTISEEKSLRSTGLLSLSEKEQYSICAIEQPELHLHPALQAKMAECFVDTINIGNKQNKNIRLIVETHSEYIINKIGMMIASKELSHDDVQVIVFNKIKPSLPTEISIATYNEKGYLNNWPFGFFNAND